MNIASSSRSQLLRWTSTATRHLQRSFATEVTPQPSFADDSAASSTALTKSASSQTTPAWKLEGRTRPPPTNTTPTPADHPLYAFFRRAVSSKEDVEANPDTPAKYVPFEPYWDPRFESGRPWTARELRRKSFKDLHVLWYVIARERNLLATQRQTVARYGMWDRTRFSYPDLDRKCRTTMARIKQVLNERRLAYLDAAKILNPTTNVSEAVTSEEHTDALLSTSSATAPPSLTSIDSGVESSPIVEQVKA